MNHDIIGDITAEYLPNQARPREISYTVPEAYGSLLFRDEQSNDKMTE